MMAQVFTLGGTALLLAACAAPLMTSYIPTASVAQTAPADVECSVNGIELFGRVHIVEHDADVRVKMVEHFADLNVDPFSTFPNDCGEWQFVEHNADFTIRFVESNADIEIELVQAFAGMR